MKWTEPHCGVQHLDADLTEQQIRQVSVCCYEGCSSVALAFPVIGAEPIWEETFYSANEARAAVEQRFMRMPGGQS